ncbi:DUF262 domain-containing protein [Microbacterium sp. PAMC22086]|uniref:DUF262 domain-containing protein n=1 Tax=Microbacterium sp. PAMC22086 TaxID=2861281 RepID=UPI001C630C65|nr:DUF262 domain-containing protein [Microbacterium sp. PAMC22086]QYG12541.1 DUF262 domain-containing protein [Microbacterium sp. PAMC22086]
MVANLETLSGILDRQPTLQNITWLLSLRKFGQLDLDPPYQRKSVWTLREKRRFLDTVLRNYPSPAIFLHRSLDEEGNATYHVVDGKQRLTTILDFADNKLRLPPDFGDERLDGQNWKGLSDFVAARKAFWGYQLTVEFIDDVHEPLVREIFSRLNQNSRKLERQELRHARFDGWLLDFVEQQAQDSVWKTLKVSTRARAKRMTDAQLLLEYAQVLIEGHPVGFDQDSLDELCANFDDPDSLEAFDTDTFEEEFVSVAESLVSLVENDQSLLPLLSSRNNFYSVWALAVSCKREGRDLSAERLRAFLADVESLKAAEKENPQRDRTHDDPAVAKYLANSAGAATEGPQRLERHEALLSAVAE